MKVVSALPLCLLAAVLVAPIAAAQEPAGVPVTSCKSQCDPQATDVNGATPKTGDTPVKTILYGHFASLTDRAPINAQRLNEHDDVIDQGFPMPTINTATDTPIDEYVFLHYNQFTPFIMFSSAGLVEFGDEGRRIHTEGGVAQDLVLNGETMNLYWYLSAHPVPGSGSGGNPLPDAIPQVGIFAQIETGRSSFKGTVIAKGDTGDGDAANLTGGAGRTNVISMPGQDDIYEFKVPLKIEKKVIPRVLTDVSGDLGDQGFIVTVVPYQIKAKDGQLKGTEFMQMDWRARMGPQTPPRVVFAVDDPMMTKAKSLNLFEHHLYIRWSFASPWGSYDLDQDHITTGKAVRIEGPQTLVSPPIQLVTIHFSRDHNGHFLPVNVTWRLDYYKANLPDGDYVVKLEVPNLQGTYLLEDSMQFKVVHGVPQDVPTYGAKAGASVGAAQPVKSGAKGLLPALDVFGSLVAIAAVGSVVLRRPV